MRDPARIDPVLAAVREIWRRYPDLRLGQLLVNAMRLSEPCPELYSVEDDVLLRELESMAERWGRLDT